MHLAGIARKMENVKLEITCSARMHPKDPYIARRKALEASDAEEGHPSDEQPESPVSVRTTTKNEVSSQAD